MCYRQNYAEISKYGSATDVQLIFQNKKLVKTSVLQNQAPDKQCFLLSGMSKTIDIYIEE